MRKVQLPQVLKKKLVFGDCDQIDAVREYDKEMEEKEWVVYVEVEYSKTITVVATSQEDAEDIAKEEFNDSVPDFDISFHATEKP